MTKEEMIAEAKRLDALDKKKNKKPNKQGESELELQTMIHYDDKISESEPIVITRPEREWDVRIGDTIEYFDPELSYEITGYRPITKDKGLDFDPSLFTVAASTYRKYNRYTQLLPGTFAHLNYWKSEFDKCRNGITIGKYTLTGENYFFLNYYRLLSVLGTAQGEEIRNEDFPGFMAKQYEYFHYLELCRKIGKDGIAFKSRGVGCSEIAASNLVCQYTFHKNSYNIVAAFDEKYVTQTLTKVWQELDFLNTCTETAFMRARMKVDTQFKKRASVVDVVGNEFGWLSTIEGVTTDNPRKLRGNRVSTLYFEEAGSNPKLIDTYIQSTALVEILGRRIGCRIVFGTGGDSGANLAGLKSMFYNPEDYNILPYRHKYSRNKEYTITGYFIPSYSLWFGTQEQSGFDNRGVVDEDRAKQYYEKKWSKIKEPSLLIKDKAEYCFTPEDAFVLEGSNFFNSEKLAEQQINIDQNLVEKPKNANLRWPLKDGEANKLTTPILEFVEWGKVSISELPITDESGHALENLYTIGIDAIDSDETTSTGQTDVSKYCIVVYRRQFGLKSPKIVALYKDRPRDVRDAHNMAEKLAQYYNAKILFEATRVSICSHFKNDHLEQYFLRRPAAVTTATTKNKRQYGCPADQKTIEHQLELIQNYVEDFYEQIVYPEVIDELLRYSYENKRKFDIVAAFGRHKHAELLK